jgi:hypothetical protein
MGRMEYWSDGVLEEGRLEYPPSPRLRRTGWNDGIVGKEKKTE